MNKSEFIAVLAKTLNTTKTEAAKILEALLQSISGALKSTGSLQITGFGKFEVKRRKERLSFNPQNGKQIKVPATNVIKFGAGKDLKETVNS